jgi:hypothetical protein
LTTSMITRNLTVSDFLFSLFRLHSLSCILSACVCVCCSKRKDTLSALACVLSQHTERLHAVFLPQMLCFFHNGSETSYGAHRFFSLSPSTPFFSVCIYMSLQDIIFRPLRTLFFCSVEHIGTIVEIVENLVCAKRSRRFASLLLAL